MTVHSQALFKPEEPWDEDQAKKAWNILELAFNKILNHESSSLSFEELYRTSYYLVLYRYAPELYDGTRNCLLRFLKKLQKDLIELNNNAVKNGEKYFLMINILKYWKSYLDSSELIKDVLMYLERNYIVPERRIPIAELSYNLFKYEILTDINTGLLFRSEVINLLSDIRKNNIEKIISPNNYINNNNYNDFMKLLNQTFSMLQTLSQYKETINNDNKGLNKENYSEFLKLAKNTEYADRAFDFAFGLDLIAPKIISTNFFSHYFQIPLLIVAFLEYKNLSVETLKNSKESLKFIQQVEELVLAETSMLTSIGCPSSTITKLRNCIETTCIIDNADYFIHSDEKGLSYMLSNRLYEHIKILFCILRYTEYEDIFLKKVGNDIEIEFDNLKRRYTHHSSIFVEQMIDLYNNYQKLITYCFENCKKFSQAIVSLCRKELRKDDIAPMSVAKYVDKEIINAINTGHSLSNLQAKCQTLFVVIGDDSFEAAHRQLLYRRLFQYFGKVISYEHDMLKTIQQTTHNIHKIQRALKDADICCCSNDQKDTMISKYNDGFITSTVLALPWFSDSYTYSRRLFLPDTSTTDITILPMEIQEICRKFENNYCLEYTGRKLTWLITHCSVEIGGYIFDKWLTLTVSAIQLCVLLLFNEVLCLDMDFIQKKLGNSIQKETLQEHISKLVANSVLLEYKSNENTTTLYMVNSKSANEYQNIDYLNGKNSQEMKVEQGTGIIENNHMPIQRLEDDCFSTEFIDTESSFRIRTNSAQDTNETAVNADLLIQSCIVKNLKIYKKIEYSQLAEILNSELGTKIPVNPLTIKKNIEKLIDRDYIERDSHNVGTYRYLS